MFTTESKTFSIKSLERLMKIPALKKTKKRQLLGWIGLICCILCATGLILHKIKKLERKQKRVNAFFKDLQSGMDAHGSYFGKTPIPLKLATIPFGESSGLVTSVKEIFIRNVEAPYNATLVPSRHGYDLFFRYDTLSYKAKHAPFLSKIGVVRLNHEFEQTDQEFKQIKLGTGSPEDPRALLVDNKLYLVYNVLRADHAGRSMEIAQIDRDTYEANYTTMLDEHLQWIEKNWSPFAYQAEKDQATLYFEYQLLPRKIFQLPDPRVNALQNTFSTGVSTPYLKLPWEQHWGQLRGGTPAQLVDGEYLGFFHSSFSDEKELLWYVMGAYTFENQPPFRLTGISECPILYQGIYETQHRLTAPINKRVCFPGGFVLDEEQIHLALGENDSGIKIVTLNKQKLLDSLRKIETD